MPPSPPASTPTTRPRSLSCASSCAVPSDNPPGDCARHGECAATLLERLGFTVERHPVPAAVAAAAGMASVTNLIVRHRFGDGSGDRAQRARRRGAAGHGLDAGSLRRRDRRRRRCTGAASRSRNRISPPTPSRCKALIDAGTALAGTVELHFTYDEEIRRRPRPEVAARRGHHAAPTTSSAPASPTASSPRTTAPAPRGHRARQAGARGDARDRRRRARGGDRHPRRALRDRAGATRANVSAVAGIGSPQLNVGLIEGGINTNVVPDRVTFRLDRRIIPEETRREVEAELRADRRARRWPRTRAPPPRCGESCWPSR